MKSPTLRPAALFTAPCDTPQPLNRKRASSEPAEEPSGDSPRGKRAGAESPGDEALRALVAEFGPQLGGADDVERRIRLAMEQAGYAWAPRKLGYLRTFLEKDVATERKHRPSSKRSLPANAEADYYESGTYQAGVARRRADGAPD